MKPLARVILGIEIAYVMVFKLPGTTEGLELRRKKLTNAVDPRHLLARSKTKSSKEKNAIASMTTGKSTTEKYSRENSYLEEIVSDTLSLYRKSTDPSLLEDILNNDMMLGDLQSVQDLFAEELNEPVPLKPMVKDIVRSIVEKHPAFVEFLVEAQERSLLPNIDGATSKRLTHHIYMLEKLTKQMGGSWEFMVEIHDHLMAKREAMGLPPGFMDSVLTLYSLTGNLFEPIKIKTMDWVFYEYKKIRERGEILSSEIIARQQGTTFNIMEAVVSDNSNGFANNAMAGIGLAVNPPETLRVSGDSRFIEYEVSQEWMSLYHSWNYAFIQGNVAYFYVLCPKLLIPSVINAEPNMYLFNRVLALWVSINFFIFAQLTQKPELIAVEADELAQLHGEINERYANDYVNSSNGVELDTFADYLGTSYDMLWDQLKSLLIASEVITPEEAQMLTDLLEQP